jgi:predicted acylesterase/phospholipase RssA
MENAIGSIGASRHDAPQSAFSSSYPEGSKRHRLKQNRRAKSEENALVAESKSKTALVLGGGAPNMALMAGALAGFEEAGVAFDIISTSGAGAVIALLQYAPKGVPPHEALRNVVDLSVADAIYNLFPINYKVFNKPGFFADWYRQMTAANPFLAPFFKPQHAPQAALMGDLMQLAWATMCPSIPDPSGGGLCARLPFIENVVDFDKVKNIKPYFYMSAFSLTREMMVDFAKEEITIEHFRAALAFPFIYGPYKLGNELFYEGAVRECVNYKDLVEKHTGLETIVVLDVLGSDTLIRAPRNLYDSWVLSMIIPLVKIAEDDTELFAIKHNGGFLRSEGAKSDLFKLQFDIPDEYLAEVLDWSSSNAQRLFQIGYESSKAFAVEHERALGLVDASSEEHRVRPVGRPSATPGSHRRSEQKTERRGVARADRA